MTTYIFTRTRWWAEPYVIAQAGNHLAVRVGTILTLASFGYYEKYMHVTKLLNTVVTYAKVWSAVKACTNKIEKWATHKTLPPGLAQIKKGLHTRHSPPKNLYYFKIKRGPEKFKPRNAKRTNNKEAQRTLFDYEKSFISFVQNIIKTVTK